MATKTGLLKKKTIRESARALAVVTEEELFLTVVSALQKSPQFGMPLLRRQAFLETIQRDEDAKQTLKKLVCCLAQEYSSLMLSCSSLPAAARYTTLYNIITLYNTVAYLHIFARHF